LIRYLKTGKDAAARAAADAQVRGAVEKILADIDPGRRARCARCSQRFDQWSPESFRPPACGHREGRQPPVATRQLEDIRFAQDQIRHFAQIQRDSMQDVEVETLPGVVLGHRHIPVNNGGLLHPGRQVPA